MISGKNISLLIVILFILLPVGYAFYLWPDLPATIPTHFGVDGKPDAWGKKESIFMLPAIMGGVSLFVFLLLSNLRKFDPKRYGNTDDPIFRQFALLIVAFMNLMCLIILYNTVHQNMPINKMIFVFLGIFFAAMGLFMPRLRQNYFAGFRLPWTLENNENWTATHRVAGKWWVAGGAIQLVSALVLDGKILFIVFFIIMMIMVIVPIVFSYNMFRATNNKRQV
ncbi:MAG TPA: SdpI family protein [Chitinophagaceae bacterium]|nr:SdpI family protein [Chitinophagaceae bacterium]